MSKRSLFLCLLFCITLTACGKRAAHVDPPPDLVKDEFPRIYPDPATDPKPQGY